MCDSQLSFFPACWLVVQIRVQYTGWGSEWDEYIRAESSRLVQCGTYCAVVKAWCLLPQFSFYWPCKVNNTVSWRLSVCVCV